jgi:hypothetical protein
VAIAIAKLHHDPDPHPDHEPTPRGSRQAGHERTDTTADSAGTIGTRGVRVRKGRSRSGRVRRRTITPIETITNAISVPMLTSSPSTPIGVKPAEWFQTFRP